MLFLVALTPIIAEETEAPKIDVEGLEEALKALEEEGTESVPVPIPLMRNSLWYYEHYFIEKESRVDLEKQNEALQYRLRQSDLDNAELKRELHKTERVLYIVGGYAITVSLTTLILLLI